MAETAAATPSTDQVLEFSLGDQRFCVSIDAINEIVKADDVTPMPNTAPEIEGLMDLRGQTTVIVNPKHVFGSDRSGTGTQVIIFDDETGKQVGWLVDRAHRVGALENPELDPVADNEYVKGVVDTDGEFTLWIDPRPVNEPVERPDEH